VFYGFFCVCVFFLMFLGVLGGVRELLGVVGCCWVLLGVVGVFGCFGAFWGVFGCFRVVFNSIFSDILTYLFTVRKYIAAKLI